MYHTPVMLKECIEGLEIKPDGIYVDVTFGGGGHTKEILKYIKSGKVFSFDQDEDAKANADKIEERSFTLIEANFRHLKRYLKLNGITQVDGLLADLGISSHQIDSAERGFSTRFDAELDMRMDRNTKKTAKEIVANYPEKELHKIFGMYGEVTNAKTLAAAIVKGRANNKINTVEELKAAIKHLAPRGKENKYYAQVFQALRIEVNDELKALEEMLVQSAEVIKPGGKLVVMSYHSLEDRLVKNFIGKGLFHGEPEKDVYGNYSKPFEAENRKPIEASEEEVELNKRARSAKLRIAVKL
jgi:16S rRNA (cytosine1402-N4)-methyltransferase